MLNKFGITGNELRYFGKIFWLSALPGWERMVSNLLTKNSVGLDLRLSIFFWPKLNILGEANGPPSKN